MISLELLEHEVCASLLCRTCQLDGRQEAASHVVIYRDVCEAGGRLPRQEEFLACREHADAIRFFHIPPGLCCSGCGREVTGEPYSHIVARVEPVGLSA